MRKIVSSSILLLLFLTGKSQTPDSTQRLKFGFNVGGTYSNLQVKNKNDKVGVVNAPGFRMGIIMDIKLTDHISFSPKTELSFNYSSVVSIEDPDHKTIYPVYPALMEFASHFTYKFYTKKSSPYILLGPTYKLPLTNKNILYASKRPDVAIDLGIGFDKIFSTFNFSPEIRYSYGLMNISELNAVGQLNFHTISLVLNFKG